MIVFVARMRITDKPVEGESALEIVMQEVRMAVECRDIPKPPMLD
jgi:hypothetical protein